MLDAIELKAAAARLLYNNDRNSADYGCVGEFYRLCRRQGKEVPMGTGDRTAPR